MSLEQDAAYYRKAILGALHLTAEDLQRESLPERNAHDLRTVGAIRRLCCARGLSFELVELKCKQLTLLETILWRRRNTI
jgi:hypothetical protein